MSDSSESESEEKLNDNQEPIEEEAETSKTFKELGVCDPLVEACERLDWHTPSKIQCATLPHALEGRDIIGLAETGSGKTGAFALPILQSLLDNPQKLFALILTPTRELAFQIAQQFEALGAGIGLLVAVIVGGVEITTQAIALAKRPHIIVATPGRLVDHLENTKGFNLRALKFLVMDEADRILNMDFEVELDKILKVIPKDRKTYLYSATMTSKVAKLERASLKDPVRVEINTRYKTVDKLKQNYIFIPHKYKEKRLGSLNKFKSKASNILVCTDVAARGLDIPHVDIVFNYDVPNQSKDYIHRVGRTARAGRAGLAITFVTQYDVEQYQKVEDHLGTKLAEYPCVENEVMLLVQRTQEASEAAKVEIKEINARKRRGNKRGHDSDTEEASMKFNKKWKKGSNNGAIKIRKGR